MRSAKQAEASRRNGARSKGPITPEGKARSSRNHTTHGITAAQILLRNESQETYDRLLETYLAIFPPKNEYHYDLVRDLVNCIWRRNRIMTLEAAGFDYEMDCNRDEIARSTSQIDEPTRAHVAFTALADRAGRPFHLYSRYEARLRRAIERAVVKLEKCTFEPEPAPADTSCNLRQT